MQIEEPPMDLPFEPGKCPHKWAKHNPGRTCVVCIRIAERHVSSRFMADEKVIEQNAGRIAAALIEATSINGDVSELSAEELAEWAVEYALCINAEVKRVGSLRKVKK